MMTKKFVVNTEWDNPNIAAVIDRIFHEYNGQVPLEDLTRKLLEKFGFNPLVVLGKNDSKLHKFRECGFDEYELRGGIIYRICQETLYFCL